ncbi:MAG: hypothetical protein ACD_10C00327G0004 [uncultured bacterium]|nr:MAG: hypothetical protein ACD_10C00327G0004 [uncultured bacterium]
MNDVLPDWPLLDAALEIVEADDGAILEHAARGRVHYINGTAAYILSLCDGETDVAAISRHVQTEFALVDTPLAAVIDILRQFTAEGVVAAGLGSRE